MQLKTILNRVTNYKSFVFGKIEIVESISGQLIEVEIQPRKNGHKSQTLVYQIDDGRKRLLWIGPDRTAKTLLRFFRFLGKDRTKRLQFICSNMWQAYLKIILKKASQAIHVLDRFHVMQLIRARFPG